ncbi:MAG: hypothetical protein CHACPFDD_00952 [Phycisphaerae bacterium]|nr:hypothetical protein [Phycisphaerae bacterium]
MNPNNRNTRIVVALVAAMTAGAALLLWLERPVARLPAASLIAAAGEPFDHMVISLAPAEHIEQLAEADCAILPDGRFTWNPRGGQLRLALAAAPDGRLDQAQVLSLLGILGQLTTSRGLPVESISLAPESDPRLKPDLPPAAFDLRALLEKKGVIK